MECMEVESTLKTPFDCVCKRYFAVSPYQWIPLKNTYLVPRS